MIHWIMFYCILTLFIIENAMLIVYLLKGTNLKKQNNKNKKIEIR